MSGNNGKLGNKPFAAKRDLKEAGYKDSRLWMNRYLVGLKKWDKVAIEKRCASMSERFLKIWEYPKISVALDDHQEEHNIFDAESPTHKKMEYVIFMEDKKEIENVSALYKNIFTELFERHAESFLTTDLGKK